MAKSPVETVRVCDCYRAKDVLLLLGWTNARGERVPVSRTTLFRLRVTGQIPFITENRRLFLYPKEKIDAFISRELPQ